MSVIDKIKKRRKAAEDLRPLRQLTAIEKTREKRLRRLLNKLNAGKDVARRDLQNALTIDEWNEFELLSNDEVVLKQLKTRPKEFKRYIEMLKLADFYNTRSMSTKTTKRSKKDDLGRTGVGRLFDKGESWYESALIHLEEILTGASSERRVELLAWIDRDVEFDPGSTIGADCANIPRIKGSKSIHVKSQHEPHNIFDVRRANKTTVLQQALDSLIYDEPQSAENDADNVWASARRASLLSFGKDDEF